MKKYIPHILGAIFVLVIIGAWMLIAHLVKKPSETQVPFVAAHNYFLRNDVTEPVPAKIGSQCEFEQLCLRAHVRVLRLQRLSRHLAQVPAGTNR